jgi:hypothetical protein
MLTLLLSLLSPPAASGARDDVADLIAQIRKVGAQASGSTEARAARDKLVAQGPAALAPLLAGMDTPDVVAANWLRTAFDEIAERTLKSDRAAFPVQSLRETMLDPRRQGRVRRLALEWLTRLDPSATTKLVPPLLNDPEFRRDAVSSALERGDRSVEEHQPDRALADYSRAFDAARDVDQVRAAATKLKSLGQPVSIVSHFGFLVDWFVIGPFDGPNFEAFSTPYPPERAVDLQSTVDGQLGKLTWRRVRSDDEFGTIDLVKALTATDDAAAYAYTKVVTTGPQDVQLRCGADDNITIWLNGRQVFAKEEWQNGTRLDRFIVPVQLKAGENTLLLKVCQGPKYRDPGMSNPWSFQIRISDASGKGIVFATPTQTESK